LHCYQSNLHLLPFLLLPPTVAAWLVAPDVDVVTPDVNIVAWLVTPDVGDDVTMVVAVPHPDFTVGVLHPDPD